MDSNKKRLIEKLVAFMLQPQTFRSYLLYLHDEELDDFGLIDDEDDSFDVLDKITRQINHLWNNTRMLLNRGFTPNEVARQKDKSNVINFQEVRKNKVYPNDPCPCGSGKKYKKCCGKA